MNGGETEKQENGGREELLNWVWATINLAYNISEVYQTQVIPCLHCRLGESNLM